MSYSQFVFEVCHVGDYIREFYRTYEAGYSEFRVWPIRFPYASLKHGLCPVFLPQSLLPWSTCLTGVSQILRCVYIYIYICAYMGGCQNYGPFLDPYYYTAPNI